MRLIYDRRGVAGEMLLTIYRLVIVAMIAFFVLGVSAFVYDYYLDVRDIEARILTKKVVNCLAPEGVLDLSRFEGKEDKILDFCGIRNVERFYVKVDVSDGEKLAVWTFQQGDSGIEWIKKLFENPANVKNLEKYNLGFDSKHYSINVLKTNGEKIKSVLDIEVFVGHEF